MNTQKILLSTILVLALLLSACVPAAETVPPVSTEETVQPDTEKPVPPEDTAEPYPVDETQDPGDAYPVEDSTVQPEPGSAIGGAAYITDPSASQDDLEDQAEDVNDFAVDLYRKLAVQDGNLVFSPYSIYQAFLMVYAGADAETRAEIARVLDVEPEDDDDVHNRMNALNKRLVTPPANLDEKAQPLQINIANALWVQEGFIIDQNFLDTLSANYNAGLKLVDFANPDAARQAINLWVAAQTNDKIKDLIPQGVLDELTRLVITNAVYFKGAWQNPFDPNRTASEPFFLLDGSEQSVDMMRTSYTGAGLITDRYQAAKLPYQGGNYAMAVIMPTGDFSRFDQDLEDGDLEEILNGFDGIFGQVNLGLPKFTYESTFNLGDQMKSLGIQQAFDPQAADFTRISDEIDLYISDVLHKAFIDVNEEGTEAAAATAIAVGTTSMPADSWDITFDHPFIYLIYETTTNTVVFMGRVVAP
ncbi:MAG: serpin family protein [Anaerolineaceae bacterium]|nr:serpin family protein [Anaerolineaceae bacterium]MDD4043071.1 serpin family protein [Anaerolineaceae bacterium]MDD4576945.1 serpin family protein [Anaerolineaceae bacterium]